MARLSYYLFLELHPSTSKFLLVYLTISICLSGRRLISRALLLLIGYESDLIDPELTNLVDDVNDVAVAHADTTLDVNDTILLILNTLQHRIDFFRQLFLGHRDLAQVVLSVIRDGDDDRRLLDNIWIDVRVGQILRQRHCDSLLQERCDHHEDD